MTAKDFLSNGWLKLALVLIVGLGGGTAGTSYFAQPTQPRTDKEIREIAANEVQHEREVTDLKIQHLAGKIDDNTDAIKDLEGAVDSGFTKILERLPK